MFFICFEFHCPLWQFVFPSMGPDVCVCVVVCKSVHCLLTLYIIYCILFFALGRCWYFAIICINMHMQQKVTSASYVSSRDLYSAVGWVTCSRLAHKPCLTQVTRVAGLSQSPVASTTDALCDWLLWEDPFWPTLRPGCAAVHWPDPQVTLSHT